MFAPVPVHGQPPPPGQGNWKIEVTYQGTATANITTTGDVLGLLNEVKSLPPNGIIHPTPTGTSLATVQNSPASTTTGGVTSLLLSSLSISMPNGFLGTGTQAVSGGKMVMTLTWQPLNNHASADPAPAKVTICYRRRARVSVSVSGPAFTTSYASAQCSVDGISKSFNLSVPGTYTTPWEEDPDFLLQTLTVNNGVATKEFSLQWLLDVQADAGGDVASAVANGQMAVDFCVAGFDLCRFGGSLNGLGGNHHIQFFDPTYTRWLPLAFSPILNSQPFRTASGSLPAPWGNIHCAYSIALRAEPAPPNSPNLDENGYMILYLPSAASDGTYNAPRAPGRSLMPTNTLIPAYFILDATGNRLVYDEDFFPLNDIHSELVTLPGGYELRNAGPPGAIQEKGRYTYAFGPLVNGTAPLLSIRDEIGNQHTLHWGTNALTVTDNSSGRQLIFNKGAGGYFTSVDAPALSGGTPATRTTLAFDGSGHLTEIKVYPGGSSTPVWTETYAYGGPNGDGITSVSRAGRVSTYTYTSDEWYKDPFGLPIPRMTTAVYGSASDTSSSDNGGSVQGTYTYSYGPIALGYNRWGTNARTNTITDARNNTFRVLWTLTSGQFGAINSLKVTGPTFTGGTPNSNNWKVDYTPHLNNPTLVTLTDPLSRLWQASFDTASGRVTSVSNPLNQTWQFGYSANGTELTSLTDPTNLTWQFLYGEFGMPASRLTSVKDPGNAVRMTVLYNAYGQPTQVTIPSAVSASGTDETTTFAYDPLKGDLTSVTDPLGDRMTVNAYDALGDPLSFSVYPDTGNPATSLTPLTTTITYNAAQMPTQISDPSGTSLSTIFNNGTPTQFRLVNQGVTRAQMDLFYDTRGRLYRATDLVGIAAQYRYDKNSNLTQVWDGKGNKTKFTYGPNNEPTGVIWPDNRSASALYDSAGRLRQTTDERGIVANYLYDAANRLQDVQFPAHSSHNVHLDYDSAGRITRVTDATGGTTFTYDPVRKRLTGVTTLLGGQNYTVSYTYYGDGKVASMTSPVGTTTYAYDAAGRLISMTNPFGEVTTWAYDHAGRVLSETTTPPAPGVPIQTAYTYGVSGQGGDPSTSPSYLRTITQRVNGQVFWTYTLTHSYLNQLLSLQGTGSDGTSESAVYVYDNRGRLTSDTNQYITGGQTFSFNGSYTYDLANNLRGGSGGWTHNSNNQVTVAGAAQGGGLAGMTGLSYDFAGNLKTANGMTLSYDVWGQLSSVSNTPYGTVSFTYDVFGRRVSKTVGGQTTYYLYDGDALIAEVNSSGQVVRSYTWGALGLVSDRAAGQSRFYLYDRSGHTRALLSHTGTLLSRGAYTAWGSPYGGLSPSTPLAWCGRWGVYRDGETGLLRMGARYYAPALGRFLSRDPSGFVAGPNLYAYSLDDPINAFDATGQYPEWVESIFNRRNLVGAVGAGTGFFGGGPVGAVGGWFAGTGLYDATENLGDTVGLADGGKASSADVWWASGRVALNVGLAVFPAFSMAGGAGRAGGGGITPAGTTGGMVELYHFTSGEAAQGIMAAGKLFGGRGLWRPWASNDVYFSASPNVSWFTRTFIYGLSPAKQQVIVPVLVPASRVIWRPFGIRIVPGPVPFR